MVHTHVKSRSTRDSARMIIKDYIMVKCRLKLEINSTVWYKHGDHPNVMQLPDHVNFSGSLEKSSLGCLQNGNNLQVFGPGTRIIDTGGNVFPVDDEYYESFYEELPE